MDITCTIFILVFMLCMWPVPTLIVSLFAILIASVTLLLWQAWLSLGGLALFGLVAFGAWVVIGLPLALGNLPQSK